MFWLLVPSPPTVLLEQSDVNQGNAWWSHVFFVKVNPRSSFSNRVRNVVKRASCVVCKTKGLVISDSLLFAADMWKGLVTDLRGRNPSRACTTLCGGRSRATIVTALKPFEVKFSQHLFTFGINVHSVWSDPKRATPNTGVNALKTRSDPTTKATFKGAAPECGLFSSLIAVWGTPTVLMGLHKGGGVTTGMFSGSSSFRKHIFGKKWHQNWAKPLAVKWCYSNLWEYSEELICPD